MSTKELDAKIKSFFDKVQTAKDVVENAKKRINKDWITKGVFEINGRSFNLKFATREEVILRLSEIITLRENFSKATELLNTKEKFKLGVNTFDDILEDFKKRLATLEIKDKEKELELLTEKLNLIAPEDVKRERILKEIEERLNSLN